MLLRAGGRLYRSDLFLRACEWAAPLGFIAVLAGWTTTEVGRQPWTVYGLLRTAEFGDAVADRLDVAHLVAGYIVVYLHHVPCRALADGAASCGVVRKRRQPEGPIAGGRPGSPVEALPAGRTEGGGMRTIMLDLVPIWTLILGLGVFFYVLLDGFDLGVGILYGLRPTPRSRNLMMNSIAPIWDGNETWLVLGGLGLLAAFPLAFAIIMPAVYFPIAIMLLALVFRGVAFEFRFRDAEHRGFWDHGFAYGSTDRDFRARRRAGRFHPGLQGRRPAFHRRQLRLLHAFLAVHRHGALLFGYALLGRRLADPEDRRRAAGVGAAAWPHRVSRRRSWRSRSSACGRR